MLLTAGLVSAVIALAVAIGALAFAAPRLYATLRGNDMIKQGHPAEGRVLAIAQTGLFLNQMPQMQLTVSVHDAGVERTLTIRQFIDLGNMPRTGERVRLMIDDLDVNRAAYVRPIVAD